MQTAVYLWHTLLTEMAALAQGTGSRAQAQSCSEPRGVYFIHSNLYLLVPNSYFTSPTPFPFGNHRFVFCVCEVYNHVDFRVLKLRLLMFSL